MDLCRPQHEFPAEHSVLEFSMGLAQLGTIFKRVSLSAPTLNQGNPLFHSNRAGCFAPARGLMCRLPRLPLRIGVALEAVGNLRVSWVDQSRRRIGPNHPIASLRDESWPCVGLPGPPQHRCPENRVSRGATEPLALHSSSYLVPGAAGCWCIDRVSSHPQDFGLAIRGLVRRALRE